MFAIVLMLVLFSVALYPQFYHLTVVCTCVDDYHAVNTAVGKVNLTNTSMRLKWGIGRIIAEVKSTPIVLPFWHSGQQLHIVYIHAYIQ